MLTVETSLRRLVAKANPVSCSETNPVWRPTAYREDLAAMLKLVGATFPLREAAQAHRALESRSVAGKIVLITT